MDDKSRVRPAGSALKFAEELVLGEAAEAEDSVATRVLKGEFSSMQIADPFDGLNLGGSNGTQIIEPDYSFPVLVAMVLSNSVLLQCVSAMVTNISGHGYSLEYVGEENLRGTNEAKVESDHIKAFMATPNDEYSMTELRKRVRWDIEATGNGYIEFARDAKGRVSALWHLPATTMRVTTADKTAVSVSVDMARFGTTTKVKVDKNFRRYVQRRGADTVYFKEYGDPRTIDPTSGMIKDSMKLPDSATEVLHLRNYHAGSVYGLPRWINNVVAVQGSRQAELTNLDFFNDNAVPAMMVLVSGGQVTQNTLDTIEGHFTALKGRKARNRVMFLEAFGDSAARDDKGTIPPPKLEVKALDSDRPSDGLFLEYDKVQKDKIRGSFRLPPIFIGDSQDYTHATANTSYEVAESQIFGPDRVADDEIVNGKVLVGYDLKHWRVKSNPPKITDPKEVVDAVSTFDAVGAMTPNVAIGMANSLFEMSIDAITEDWGNMPFSLVKELSAGGTLPTSETLIDSLPKEKPPAKKGSTDEIVSRALMDLRDLVQQQAAPLEAE